MFFPLFYDEKAFSTDLILRLRSYGAWNLEGNRISTKIKPLKGFYLIKRIDVANGSLEIKKAASKLNLMTLYDLT